MSETLRRAQTIASYLVKVHFPENQNWRPFESVNGVLDQIDNAITKWATDKVEFDKANNRLKAAEDIIHSMKIPSACSECRHEASDFFCDLTNDPCDPDGRPSNCPYRVFLETRVI